MTESPFNTHVTTIPDHWRIERGKGIFQEIDEKSTTGEEELLTVSHKTGITPRSQKNVTMFKAESTIGYKLVNKGDLVSNIMWMFEGAIGVSKYDGLVSPSYAVYRQRAQSYLPDYLDLLLRERSMIGEYTKRSKGIRKSRLRLYPNKFLDILFPIPPITEQYSILNYIGDSASKINELIELKKKEIQLYVDFKTKTIDDLIVGSNESITAPCSLEYVSKIPSDCNVVRSRYLTTQYTGDSIPDGEKDNYPEVPNSRPYVATNNVDQMSSTIHYTSGIYIKNDDDGFCVAPAGSTLLCIEGGSTGKKVAKIDQDVAFVNKLCCLTPDNIDSDYLFYVCSSNITRQQIFRSITGLIPGISSQKLKNIKFIVPPVDKQQAIAKQLTGKVKIVNEVIEHLQEEIKLLQEYYSNLITSAMMGKIDTRGKYDTDSYHFNNVQMSSQQDSDDIEEESELISEGDEDDY